MPLTNTNTTTSTMPTIAFTNTYNTGTGGTEQQSSGSADSEPANFDSLVAAHAVLLGVAFVFAFPLGMILLRLPTRFAGLNGHRIWQLITVVAVLAGFIIALIMSTSSPLYRSTNQAHQILGIIVISLMLLFQPLLGILHHYMYKRIGRRTTWGWIHISFGRVLILAGMVNTCL